MKQAIPPVLSRADGQAATALHEKFQSYARSRAQDALLLGKMLVEAQERQLHRLFGDPTFYAYVEKTIGLKRREVEERLRVARALESLPRLEEAFRESQIHWSALRELSRVATTETEAEWLGFALGKRAWEVERKVAGHRRGDRPSDQPTAEPPRRVSFEVSAPTWALLQEARQKLTQAKEGAVSDDELLQALAQSLLSGGGCRDERVSAYQMAMRVCDQCKTATLKAGADQVVVDDVRLDQAMCDARHLGSVDSPDPPRARQSVPPRIREAVFARHGGCCAAAGCRNAAFSELHHLDRLADGGTHDPERMLPLCFGHHRAVHEGTLHISGRYSEGFHFEHADGKRYGDVGTCPATNATLGVTLSALVSLGFKHTEAQAMVEQVRPHVGAETSQQDAIKKALCFAPMGSSTSRGRGKSRRSTRRGRGGSIAGAAPPS